MYFYIVINFVSYCGMHNHRSIYRVPTLYPCDAYTASRYMYISKSFVSCRYMLHQVPPTPAWHGLYLHIDSREWSFCTIYDMVLETCSSSYTYAYICRSCYMFQVPYYIPSAHCKTANTQFVSWITSFPELLPGVVTSDISEVTTPRKLIYQK